MLGMRRVGTVWKDSEVKNPYRVEVLLDGESKPITVNAFFVRPTRCLSVRRIDLSLKERRINKDKDEDKEESVCFSDFGMKILNALKGGKLK